MAQPQIPMPHVDQWVTGRVRNVVSIVPRGIRFEASMYGPLLSYLATFFPAHRRFMIKPQAILRPKYIGDFMSDIAEQGSDGSVSDRSDRAEMEEGGDDVSVNESEDEPREPDIGSDSEDEDVDWDDARDTSFDSYGDPTPSRDEGSAQGIRFPDFLIVKATESLTDDTILIIVEVKRDSRSLPSSRRQIQQYLQLAATKRRVRFLQGFLIVGDVTESYYLNSEHRDAVAVRGPSFVTTNLALKARLHQVAAQNW
ncbi:hypothetical protein BDZ97DRAFT_1840766 [Flammula alnicola]|nr:hypothetical protein BDZ97DRAFT_1840766 [Flammula alnicola]